VGKKVSTYTGVKQIVSRRILFGPPCVPFSGVSNVALVSTLEMFLAHPLPIRRRRHIALRLSSYNHVRLCGETVCESVFNLYISGMHERVQLKITTITHYRTHGPFQGHGIKGQGHTAMAIEILRTR